MTNVTKGVSLLATIAVLFLTGCSGGGGDDLPLDTPIVIEYPTGDEVCDTTFPVEMKALSYTVDNQAQGFLEQQNSNRNFETVAQSTLNASAEGNDVYSYVWQADLGAFGELFRHRYEMTLLGEEESKSALFQGDFTRGADCSSGPSSPSGPPPPSYTRAPFDAQQFEKQPYKYTEEQIQKRNASFIAQVLDIVESNKEARKRVDQIAAYHGVTKKEVENLIRLAGERRSEHNANLNSLQSELQSVAETENSATQKFSVSGNHPNPFESKTAFSYTLPEASHVRIEIYSVTGQLVETLVDRRQSAGSHRTTWNAERLASGTYLYRLDAGSRSASGKLTLVK